MNSWASGFTTGPGEADVNNAIPEGTINSGDLSDNI